MACVVQVDEDSSPQKNLHEKREVFGESNEKRLLSLTKKIPDQDIQKEIKAERLLKKAAKKTEADRSWEKSLAFVNTLEAEDARSRKEAAEKREAERLAREAAEKREAERLAREDERLARRAASLKEAATPSDILQDHKNLGFNFFCKKELMNVFEKRYEEGDITWQYCMEIESKQYPVMLVQKHHYIQGPILVQVYPIFRTYLYEYEAVHDDIWDGVKGRQTTKDGLYTLLQKDGHDITRDNFSRALETFKSMLPTDEGLLNDKIKEFKNEFVEYIREHPSLPVQSKFTHR